MNFIDILKKDIGKYNLLLGHNDTEEFIINIKETPSLIITGETGSGKSILLDQIILEMITKFSSTDMELMTLDTSGVELNYYENLDANIYHANSNEDIIVGISKVIREIDRRKELINKTGYKNIYDYNYDNNNEIPLLFVTVDEDKFLLREADMEKMLSTIVSQVDGLNIFFVLVTSDVHNKFFESDDNILSSMQISFDYTNIIEEQKANLKGAANLAIGEFIVSDNNSLTKYNNFEFDDDLIMKVVNKEI